MSDLSLRDRTTLVHFYRAVVAHADVWRQRMDVTTNWAVATTAAMITFALGAQAPHYILLLTLGFDSVFLLMESRRYQRYHLWRQRFLALNRILIAPALAPGILSEARIAAGLRDLATDLAVTMPRLSFPAAAGYRLRRNYGYIFGLVAVAWAAKLSAHPDPAGGWREVVARARIGLVPGTVVATLVGLYLLLGIVLALRAPSEHTAWDAFGMPIGEAEG